jgi:hypothetical protein
MPILSTGYVVTFGEIGTNLSVYLLKLDLAPDVETTVGVHDNPKPFEHIEVTLDEIQTFKER